MIKFSDKRKEAARKLCIERNTTHGMSHTRFYKIWKDVKKRCTNSKHQRFADYGGRGIKVTWQSFEAFRDDMYESYLAHVKRHGESQTTIDRINTNKHYSVENCQWATHSKNCRNKRNNVVLTFKGKTLTLIEWAELLEMNYGTLRSRIKYGLPVSRILNKKLQYD